MPVNQQPDETEALEGVNRVVLQAISALAPHGGSQGVIRKPLESYLTQMRDAALSFDRARLFDVIKDMRKARIPSLQIAESYVPTVARRLGDDWLADRVDFAGVSIGASRLQAVLRRLEMDWGLPREAKFDSPPAFIVGVPDGAQHTLGASVLAGQLRHRGLSVHLDLEMTPQGLAQQVRHEHYNGVLISAGSFDDLESCRVLVESSKKESRNTPVIVGGSILQQSSDIGSEVRADLLTSDIHDALRHCDVASGQSDADQDFGPGASYGMRAPDDLRSAAE